MVWEIRLGAVGHHNNVRYPAAPEVVWNMEMWHRISGEIKYSATAATIVHPKSNIVGASP